MLSEKQEAWLAHLSDTDTVKIISYDPKVKEVFQKQKEQIQTFLGSQVSILHKGASAWGISGKGDLDMYIPVEASQFDNFAELLKGLLGEPGSFYPKERVRWTKSIDGIETETFLVNQEADFWKENLIFWDYIESHPKALEEYKKLKENGEGLSTREYYQVKTEFYNKIVSLIRSKME